MLVAARSLVVGAALAAVGCAARRVDAAARVVTAPAARVVAERVAYGRWSDAWRLSDGRIELVVVPAIGRVMRLARVGGANLLWEHPAPGDAPAPQDNLGGEKVWAWPQSSWPAPWPPPFPRAPYRVEIVDGPGLRLVSPADPTFGVRVEEELRLVGGEDAVEVVARFAARPAAPALVPWSVLQLRTPEALVAHRMATARLPDGWKAMIGAPSVRAGDAWLHLPTRPAQPCKAGIDADALVWVLAGDAIVLANHDRAPDAYAPGEAMQAYAQANDPQQVYVELETIAPRGATTLRARWSLVRVDAGLPLGERVRTAQEAAKPCIQP